MKNPLVIKSSPNSVQETCARLEKALDSRNITRFAKIDHWAAARDAGMEMQDEVVYVFGDPKVGTHLMLECPEVGIELPLKILIWKGEETYVGYREPKLILESYEVKSNAGIIEKMSGLMQMLVDEITQK